MRKKSGYSITGLLGRIHPSRISTGGGGEGGGGRQAHTIPLPPGPEQSLICGKLLADTATDTVSSSPHSGSTDPKLMRD